LLSGAREGFADATLVDSIRRELNAQGALVPPVKVRRRGTVPTASASGSPPDFVTTGAGMMVGIVGLGGSPLARASSNPAAPLEAQSGSAYEEGLRLLLRSAVSRLRNGASDYRCFGPWVIS
jgi:hypothetical protein